MKKYSLILFFLLSAEIILQGQESNYRINWDYDGQSFAAFVKTAESQYNLRFFYKSEWVSGITLRKYDNVTTVPQLLDIIFQNSKIFHFIDKAGNIILTRDYKIKTDKLNGRNILPIAGINDGKLLYIERGIL